MAHTEDLTVSSLPESGEQAATTAKKSAVEAISGAKDAFKTFKGKVSESAHKAADTSKDYLHSAKQSIEDMNRKAFEKGRSDQPNLTKTKQSTGKSGESSSTGSTELQSQEGYTVRESKSQEESMAFPLSILVWCSTLCSRKNPTPEAPDELEVETGDLVEETKQLMTEDVDRQVSTPEEFVEEVSSALKSQVSTAKEFVEATSSALQSEVSTPKEIVEAASSALQSQVNTVVEDSIGKDTSAFKSETSTIIKESAGETRNGFKYKFEHMVGHAEAALKSKTEFISDSVDEGSRAVKSKIEDVGDAVGEAKTALKSKIEDVGDAVGEAKTALKSKLESVGGSLDEGTRAFKSKFESLGEFKPKLFS